MSHTMKEFVVVSERERDTHAQRWKTRGQNYRLQQYVQALACKVIEWGEERIEEGEERIEEGEERRGRKGGRKKSWMGGETAPNFLHSDHTLHKYNEYLHTPNSMFFSPSRSQLVSTAVWRWMSTGNLNERHALSLPTQTLPLSTPVGIR